MVSKIGSETGLEVPEIFNEYKVLEPEKVNWFLGENPFLKPLLSKAAPNISANFHNPQLFLQLVTDKEDPADTRLVISINPAETPKEAFEKLTLLRQQWWFDASEATQDKLEIILRYRHQYFLDNLI